MGGIVREPAPESGPLPVIAAVLCLLVAAWIFMRSTVPALAERDRLQALEAAEIERLTELVQHNTRLRTTTGALDHDPQTVLMEIDRLGLMPDELLARTPAIDASGPNRRNP